MLDFVLHGRRDKFVMRIGETQEKRIREWTECLAAFSNYSIKWYIPRVWRDILDFLAVKRDANQFWTQPFSTPFQKVKTTVEVTSAHSYSKTILIESDDRRDNDIECICGDRWSDYGFHKTESIGCDFSIGFELPKKHSATDIGHGRKNALSCAPRARNDICWINFVVGRQVTCDCLARHEFV